MVRWIDGTMDLWHNGMMRCMMAWWYDGMNDQWHDGTMVGCDGTMSQWLMVLWLDGEDNKDEDKEQG